MLNLMDIDEYCFELSQTLPLEFSEIKSVVIICLSDVSSGSITLAQASENIVTTLFMKVSNKPKKVNPRKKERLLEIAS